MSEVTWLPDEEVGLARYLVKEVEARASGRAFPECERNAPRDVYFVGNLRPKPLPGADADKADLMRKVAPSAFGAEFLLAPTGQPVAARLAIHWACYYRVFPTYDQQRSLRLSLAGSSGAEAGEAAAAASTSANGVEDDGPDPFDAAPTGAADDEDGTPPPTPPSPRRRRPPSDALYPRYRRIACGAAAEITVTPQPDGSWTIDKTALEQALDAEMKRATAAAMADPERVRAEKVAEDPIKVPEPSLASPTAFQTFLRSLTIDVVPTWRWEVEARVDVAGGSPTFVLTLVNASPMAERAANSEAVLFEPEITAAFPEGSVSPFVLELAPRGFRYDRRLPARGFNCGIEQIQDLPPIFRTTLLPVYEQGRYVSHEQPAARFADLASDPIPVLEEIQQKMEEYRATWAATRSSWVASDPDWETKFGGTFDGEQQRFEAEIARFERGVDLVRANPDVALAFKLTNETFARTSRTAWRLFQVIFLVGQIPGIAALANPKSADLDEREFVDIIYFPTGGGKTEAYLGTIVFHLFFDRLRGKTAGVSAWTRFPLRLLTVQQTQRMVDIIGLAELVRRDHPDPRLSGHGVHQFAVGYFVGKNSAPNEIYNPDAAGPYDRDDADARVTWQKAQDPKARQDWKRVTRCPSCRTETVTVEFDGTKARLIHRCQQPNCAFPNNGVLPLYIVDNEIYRYLPAVMVGTIDKLAVLGNQRKFSHVLGLVDGYCKRHGFYSEKCCQKDCLDPKLLNKGAIPTGLSGPMLFVQDELHLLKENLGTFDGHYETMLQQLVVEIGQPVSLKVIASSATIEAFERQVNHLYGRPPSRARFFPGLGPTLEASFYAKTLNYPQRLFVGLLPHNKTLTNALLELIEMVHRVLQDLQRLPAGTPNLYGGQLQPGTPDWARLLDRYATTLTYFLAGRELTTIQSEIDGNVKPNLQEAGYEPLDMRLLTGDTSTDEVSSTLTYLQEERPGQPATDAVLATNMVSHGVDIDRLNVMLFMGQPRQTAEYIQAASRVGRAHVGVVLCCLHPVRERDQSHFAYFAKYHEYLGQQIEPVAINRWSTLSIRRTLPGLFMAVVLQLIANQSGIDRRNRYYMLDFVRKQVATGQLRPDQFVPLLRRAYRVATPSTPAEQTFYDDIEKLVSQFFDQINGQSMQKMLSNVLYPPPMNSLRDVEEQVPVEIDQAGQQWNRRADWGNTGGKP